MKIESLMVPNPVTIQASASVQQALQMMKTNAFRHLPVVDHQHQLCGLLTLADLKQALIPSMLSDLTLADLMIKQPITVSPDDDIETAAKIIYDRKIGGLPVIRGKTLVGIITESDILRAFIDMLGILSSSVHIDVMTGGDPEALNQVIRLILEKGCDIINVGMTADKPALRTYTFRLAPCDPDPVRQALAAAGFSVNGVMA